MRNSDWPLSCRSSYTGRGDSAGRVHAEGMDGAIPREGEKGPGQTAARHAHLEKREVGEEEDRDVAPPQGGHVEAGAAVRLPLELGVFGAADSSAPLGRVGPVKVGRGGLARHLRHLVLPGALIGDRHGLARGAVGERVAHPAVERAFGVKLEAGV